MVHVPVFVCLRSACNHVNDEGPLGFVSLVGHSLKVVMQNYGDFVDVILVCTKSGSYLFRSVSYLRHCTFCTVVSRCCTKIHTAKCNYVIMGSFVFECQTSSSNTNSCERFRTESAPMNHSCQAKVRKIIIS
jgi:hypothetical protein